MRSAEKQNVQENVFRSRVQAEQEPINQFITDIKVKSKSCNFGELADGFIRDQIVIGVNDEKLKERLLREENLTRLKAEQLCRAAEAAQKHMGILATSTRTMTIATTNKIDALKSSSYNNNARPGSYSNNTRIDCRKCGRKHVFNKCPVYGRTCFKCQAKNHFSKFCQCPTFQKKKVNVSTADQHNINIEFIFRRR